MLQNNKLEWNIETFNSKQIKFLINPNWYFPCAIITMYESNDKLFARYPSGETIEIDTPIDTSEAKEQIIEFKWIIHIDSDDYAFAVSRNDIIIWSHSYILTELNKRLLWNILWKHDKELIKRFVDNTSN